MSPHALTLRQAPAQAVTRFLHTRHNIMIDCNIFTAFNCTTNSFGVKFFKRPPEANLLIERSRYRGGCGEVW